jgi:hypothetical protein
VLGGSLFAIPLAYVYPQHMPIILMLALIFRGVPLNIGGGRRVEALGRCFLWRMFVTLLQGIALGAVGAGIEIANLSVGGTS